MGSCMAMASREGLGLQPLPLGSWKALYTRAVCTDRLESHCTRTNIGQGCGPSSWWHQWRWFLVRWVAEHTQSGILWAEVGRLEEERGSMPTERSAKYICGAQFSTAAGITKD